MSHDIVLLIMILPDSKGLLKSWCETNVSYFPNSYLQNVFSIPINKSSSDRWIFIGRYTSKLWREDKWIRC